MAERLIEKYDFTVLYTRLLSASVKRDEKRSDEITKLHVSPHKTAIKFEQIEKSKSVCPCLFESTCVNPSGVVNYEFDSRVVFVQQPKKLPKMMNEGILLRKLR